MLLVAASSFNRCSTEVPSGLLASSSTIAMVDPAGSRPSLGLAAFICLEDRAQIAEIAIVGGRQQRDVILVHQVRQPAFLHREPSVDVLIEARKSTRLNSSHSCASRMPSSA